MMTARMLRIVVVTSTAVVLWGCGATIDTLNLGVNMNPTADAGTDQNVEVGGKVALGGLASTDVDGDPLSYHWQQTMGPTVGIDNPNSATIEFVPTEDGTYEFVLTVTDDNGGSDTDTVRAFVGSARPEGAPFADAGIDQDVVEGQAVTFEGDNSADPDGGQLSYFWEQLSGPDVSLSNVFVSRPSFTAPQVGALTQLVFRLTVTDDDNLTGSDAVVITVRESGSSTEDFCEENNLYDNGICNPDCPLPDPDCAVCSSNADCDDAQFCNGAETCFGGACVTGTEPCPVDEFCDETNDECVLDDPCEGLACDDGNLCTDDVCDSATGQCISAAVQCADGEQCNPATGQCVSATVALAADAGPDIAAEFGGSVSLSGSATGGDGPYMYSWSPTTNLDDPAAATPTFTASTAGTFTFTLTVTDGQGNTATDSTAVSVAVPGQVATPVFSPSAGSYTGSVDVTISSVTTGATIRYTTDGSTPSSTAGTLFTSTIALAATTTLKAIATKTGMTDSDEASATFTLHDPIVAGAGADAAVNLDANPVGVNTTLNGSATGGDGSYTYSWSPTACLNDSNIASPDVTVCGTAPFSPGQTTFTYTLTVTDGSGNSDTDSVTLTTYRTLVANAGADTSVVAGGTVSLNGSATDGNGSYSYSWSPSTGLTSTTIANPTFTAPSVGTFTFTLTVTDGSGNTDTDTVTVTVTTPAATRSITDNGDGTWRVAISLSHAQGTSNFLVQDFPPSGWTASDTSSPGGWSSGSQSVNWIVFSSIESFTQLTYNIAPGGSGGSFSGTYTSDLLSQTVAGDTVPPSRSHPADTNGDFRITTGEADAYSTLWLNSLLPPEQGSAWILRANAISLATGDGRYYDDGVTAAPSNWIEGNAP